MSGAKPTIRAIAVRAGVAISTASQILRGTGSFSPGTVKRVRAAASELGHTPPATAGSPGASPALPVAGVVSFNTMAITLREPHARDVIRGLHGGLAGAGIPVLMLPPIDTPGHEHAMRTMPINLVFYLSTFHRIGRSVAEAAHRGIVTACIENGEQSEFPSLIRVDDVTPMRDLARHVLELGHTSVAVVSMRLTPLPRSGLIDPPDPDTVPYGVARARLQGLRDAGLAVSHVYETQSAVTEEGAAAARALMGLADAPTCIVCQSDTLAEGVIVGLRELGLRVPEDVSVTGYDGVSLSSLYPERLTTVIQDGVLKGTMFAQAGRALLAGDAVEPLFLPQYFMKGTTTAPPRPVP
jgi:DNA-binding LacI/PurR family transcriptional regulator